VARTGRQAAAGDDAALGSEDDVVKPTGLFSETVRWTDRLASMTLLRLVLWVTVVAWTHAGIFTDPWNLAQWMDDHQFYSWEESDRITLLRYGQLPAWNPYWCGGSVGIPAPEDPFLSPDFVLRLLFGVAHGRRLTIFLLVVLGLEGMYRLCRKLDASAVGSAFGALVYANCDRFVGFIRDGWIHFLGFELIPWVVLGLIAGVTSWRWRIVGGFFFAWIVLAPGTYPTPFTLIVVVYMTIALFFQTLLRRGQEPSTDSKWWRRPWVAIWISAATIGVVALGLTFGKLVPTLVWVRQFARTFTPTEMHEPTQLFSGMWPHYGAVLVIALVGVATADVAAGIFSGGAILAYALARGDYGEHAPFHILKALPIVGQLRYPDRYMVLFVFFISGAASRGITRLEDAVPALVRRLWEGIHWARRTTAPPLPALASSIAVGIATLLAYGQVRKLAEEVLTPMQIRPHAIYVEPPPRVYEQPFRQHRGNRRDGHIFPPMNMGSLYCAVGNPLPESPLLRADLPQEEYPADPTRATVKRLMWSPLAIELEVDAKAPTTIYVNQNWAPQWRASIGTVKSVEKLLAVDVPAGKNIVRLEYKDRFLVGCLLVSLATLLGLVYVFGRDGWRWLRAEWAKFDDLPWWPADLDAAPARAEPSRVEKDETRPASEPPRADSSADERRDKAEDEPKASDDAPSEAPKDDTDAPPSSKTDGEDAPEEASAGKSGDNDGGSSEPR
jgi:hypothetical protein